MSSHKIQFQPGMSIPEFLRHFGTEAQCAEAMKRARWPQGFRCPRCDDARHYLVSQGARKLFQCIGCRHQASVTAGTMMEHSKLPLTTWFLAIHLISQAKTGISALALKRDLGVSYPTAWLLHQKINRAMAGQEAAYLLDGTVQLDDAYLGGERSGGKAGRGSENKVPFVAALSLDAAGGPKHLKLDLVSGFTSQAIGQWAKARLKPSCVVRSDGLGCFAAVTDAGCTHMPRVVGNLKPKDLPEFKWINTVLGNLKTTLSGAFHALRYRKYGQIYLTAFAYRFNRRFDLRGLVAGLIVDVARSKPVPERVVRWVHAEAAF
jgi:transposase-like protein